MKGQNLRFRNYKFHLECGIYHHSDEPDEALVQSHMAILNSTRFF
jgi:hypothetical protein